MVTGLSMEATISTLTMATTYQTTWCHKQERRVKNILLRFACPQL